MLQFTDGQCGECAKYVINKYEADYIFYLQSNWKQGLKIFEKKGEDPIIKDLQQVPDMERFEPKYWSESNKDMYLKEKRCGEIKARGCVDGRKQRIYTDKQESSLSTVSLVALMLTCVIDVV